MAEEVRIGDVTTTNALGATEDLHSRYDFFGAARRKLKDGVQKFASYMIFVVILIHKADVSNIDHFRISPSPSSSSSSSSSLLLIFALLIVAFFFFFLEILSTNSGCLTLNESL